ncbi:MAG TPA: aspartate kinase [Longimicrobiales bacterium]|nr:aspartate kinase [Longimicrobiales bacterium]
MSLIVHKYGGTSVGSPERIRAVARRVAATRRAGHDVVVVVSAMADSTDDLVALAARVTADARRNHPRELDMLLTAGERIAMALTAMAIRDCGFEAISLTGSQAAIITDSTHTGARIQEVRADRVRAELARGCAVIVAGFQGISREHEVTTLGRGGSDTTAVALAAALGAERCDIFTDVDGIFTADPRRVPHARVLREVDYDDMVELAASGAQVLHPRAVEIGARYNIPIRVLSSFDNGDGGAGTLISRRGKHSMEGLVLTGLASARGQAKLTIRGLPPSMQAMTAIMSALAAAGISVDTLTPADRPDGRRQLQLTVHDDDLEQALSICGRIAGELGGESVDVRRGLTKVTLVGSGMTGMPGVYARSLEALLAAEVDVHALGTSSVSISFLVDADREDRTLQALHEAFELAKGT